MPLQATSGAASYDAFGGGVPSEPNYIESVFSCFLYTGNGSTQTITNGIDLAGDGGLVWIKSRSNAEFHRIFDTARGVNKSLSSNSTNAQNTAVNTVTAFNTTGFSLGDDSDGNGTNTNAYTYTSWTFRKQPKFFDVVTYTGNGSARTIAHNLGSVPGCIIVKCTSVGYNWMIYHSSLANTQYLNLNNTNPVDTDANLWNSTTPTSSVFSVGASLPTNQNGATYVAYLFAHNAGGFGLTGTDNVISCGSYTGNGSTDGPVIDLGYEPQWLLIKSSSASSTAWTLIDNMRGMTVGGADAYLKPNSSDAETTSLDLLSPTATGFKLTSTLGLVNGANDYIYIAIRRGPMKVPTSGTSVFQPTVWTGTGAALQQNVNINYDAFLQFRRNGGYFTPWMDKLRGFGYSLYTQSTNAEVDQTAFIAGPKQNNYINFVDGTYNLSGEPWLNDAFVRAPSFFDEVCYTGTGSGTTITHNLGVTPELVITKSRTNGALGWVVWTTNLTNTDYWIRLDSTMAQTNSPVGYGGTFSASNYTIANTGPYNALNGSGQTFVAYLFASCAGVSKVGSFTGNGSSQTINCGFTGGARFVLIKATSTTGDWMVADSARGIVSGSDPYLELNNTNAEVTGEDWLDTDSTGFVVNEVSGSNANTNGVTYIFLAIA